MADTKGLEPSTSCVTGRHSNQLNYVSMVGTARVELTFRGYQPRTLTAVLCPHSGDPSGTRTRKYRLEGAMTLTISSTGPWCGLSGSNRVMQIHSLPSKPSDSGHHNPGLVNSLMAGYQGLEPQSSG